MLQATSWDRCRRTPGERRGGAYGGLLQLRRTQAAGQGEGGRAAAAAAAAWLLSSFCMINCSIVVILNGDESI